MSMLRWNETFSKRRLSADVKALRVVPASAAVVGLLGLAMAVRLGVAVPAASAQENQQYQTGQDQSGQADPPSRVARISLLAGSVSVEPAGQDQFSAAEANYPLTTGDRMYADAGSNGELQTGQLAVRLGQQTDVTVTAMTDTLAQFGVGQGSVHLRSFGIDPGETVELDTPNVAITVLQAGDVRVDVDANSNATTVTLLSGQVQVDGNGLQQVLEPGQRVRLIGSDPVAAQWQQTARGDGLDRFSGDRDRMFESAQATESQYVNPGTIGAEDLTSYGSWESDGDYGGVWYPRGVAADWQPYSQGRWAYVSPWGWTWVASEPWGFAPFHYGRWNRFGNRWGWIPGPVVVRPVYSPALVVFVGGSRGPGGGGVTAWFPLGPREPYEPWYRTSTRYVNRVNVSNIYNRNAGEVRRNYEQRTTNLYINNTVQNRVYVNRTVATVAMPERSFAEGHGVAREVVRMNPRDLAGAPVMQRPPVAPERPVMGAAPSRPVPTRVSERPVLATHGDMGGRPGGTTQGGFGGGRAGDPRDQPAPVSRPGPGERPTPGQPTGAVPSTGNRGAGNGYGGGQPVQGSPRPGDPGQVRSGQGDPGSGRPGQGDPGQGRPGQGRPGQGSSTIGVPAAAEGGSSNGRPGGASATAPVAKPAPVENPPTIGQPRLPVNRVEPPVNRTEPPVSGDPGGNERGRPGFNRPFQGEPNQPTRNQPLAPVRPEPVAPVRTEPVAPVRTPPPAAATPPPAAPRPVAPAAAPAPVAPPRPVPGPRPAPAPARTPPPATPTPKG